MKKLLILLFLLTGFSFSSDAQFLKKLGDRIVDRAEKSAEDRINRRADRGVEKSLDKVEYGTEDAVKDATKPSDKKESPKEKAPAKEVAQASEMQPAEEYDLSITGSGPDLYLEYKMSMDGGPQADGYMMDAEAKMYASTAQGKGRSEINMQIPVLGEMSMVTLTDFNDPTQAIVINEKKKEYSIMDLGDFEEDPEEFEVTKIGNEKLHGLQTVHVVAKSKEEGEEFELWTTKEIPGYEEMIRLYKRSGRMGSDGMWEALSAAGAEGYLVQMKVNTGGGSALMSLTKVERTKVEQSQLEVPAGYKEKTGGWAKQYLKQMGK